MEVSNAIGNAADELLDRLIASLSTLPFEDDEGHYFGLGTTRTTPEDESAEP
jgi:hypothetical protein